MPTSPVLARRHVLAALAVAAALALVAAQEAAPAAAIKRSLPPGRTDVIKAMGNTK
jgi:hypothetical protein